MDNPRDTFAAHDAHSTSIYRRPTRLSVSALADPAISSPL
jgi:hypothetical protein